MKRLIDRAWCEIGIHAAAAALAAAAAALALAIASVTLSGLIPAERPTAGREKACEQDAVATVERQDRI
jgi:hypothetical protein